MDDAYHAFIQDLVIPQLPIQPLDHVLNTNASSQLTGFIMEFGVYNGRSITKIANHFHDKTVFGFDSFQGLPETWDRDDGGFEKGVFSLSGKLPNVPSNVSLIKGWFSDTIPQFLNTHVNHGDHISLLHIDCDLYSSTKTILDHLKHLFVHGTIIVFDELLNYPGFEKHELKAFYEFLQENKQWKVNWIGCAGPIRFNSPKDLGAFDQPVACILTL